MIPNGIVIIRTEVFAHVRSKTLVGDRRIFHAIAWFEM
jgi:hypothetical protein